MADVEKSRLISFIRLKNKWFSFLIDETLERFKELFGSSLLYYGVSKHPLKPSRAPSTWLREMRKMFRIFPRKLKIFHSHPCRVKNIE